MRKSIRYGKAGVRVGQAIVSVIESLEQRRLLSSSITTALVDNGDGTSTLKVTGTKNKDYIIVVDDPADPIIQIANDKNHNGSFDAGEQINEYDSSDINVVLIDSQQGDDTVKYELASSYEGSQRSIEVDLGDGNDKFTFESAAAEQSVESNLFPDQGTDILDHSSVNIEVEGQEKNDTIDIDFGEIYISQSSVLVNVDAGSGNDNVSLETPFFGIIGSEAGGTDQSGGPSDYTQLQVQVDLGSGNNLYSQFVLTEFSYAEFTVNVNGGSGKDTIQDEEDYLLEDDAAYSFTANLGSGNDYYNGDFENIEIDGRTEATYNLQGGDGNDRITFESGESETSTDAQLAQPAEGPNSDFEVEGILQVNMYGGTGNDTMDMWSDEPLAPAPNIVKPHGLPTSNSDPMNPMYIDTDDDGEVRVVMSGDAGNDKVRLNLGATENSEGDYDLSVLGAAGKDTVAAGFDDLTLINSTDTPPTSFVTFGPSGAILLDGGRDSDTYEIVSEEDFSTWPATFLTPFSVRSCETLSNSLLPPLLI